MTNDGGEWVNPVALQAVPDLSVIIPVFNEDASIGLVLEELDAVLAQLNRVYEVIVVNDGSTDNTAAVLQQASRRYASLRLVTLTPNSGQSAAFGAGFITCRGQSIILMDGDGQNDPHDIPMLLEVLKDCDACCGYRKIRRDRVSKRLASRIANGVRQAVLHDGILDTGCSLKAVKVQFVRDLPMYLRGMHRFLPALWLMRGARIRQIRVNHRLRVQGQSKYTNWRRLRETWWDLWAVRWMQTRYRRFRVTVTGAGT